MLKKSVLLMGALLCTMAVSACENTWHGMGKDTENVGEEMQRQYQ